MEDILIIRVTYDGQMVAWDVNAEVEIERTPIVDVESEVAYAEALTELAKAVAQHWTDAPDHY